MKLLFRIICLTLILFLQNLNADSAKKYKIAYDLFKDEKYNSAKKELKEYIQLYPEGEDLKNVFILLAKIYSNQNDYNSAIIYLKKITNRFPKDIISIESFLRIGEYYQKMGRYNDALQIYDAIIANNPDTEYSEEAEIQIELIFESYPE